MCISSSFRFTIASHSIAVNTPLLIVHFIVQGQLGYSQCLVIKNNAAINIPVYVLLASEYAFLCCIYPRGKLLSYRYF